MSRFLFRVVRHSIPHDVPLDDTNQGGPDNFTQTFSPGHMPTTNMDLKSQTTLHTQPIWDLGSGSRNSTRYYHENLGTDVSIS